MVSATAASLRRLGIEVEVLTRRLEPSAAAEEMVDGVRVHRLGSGRPTALACQVLDLFRAGRAWAQGHLRRFDLVHAHMTLTALPLLERAQQRGPRVVATFYGPWGAEYAAQLADPAVPSRWPRSIRPLAMPLVAPILAAAQRRVLAAATSVVVLSEHSRRELGEFGYNVASPIDLVPGGVDVDRFRPVDRDEARRRLGLDRAGGPLLVSLRRLVPRMGLELLLEAAAALRDRHPELRVAIGGEGPIQAKLARLAAERGLDGQVRLLGRVAEDDLPWLYAAADLVVLPTVRLEGFGLPVLEAWACGVPVVGTPVGALKETVGKLDPRLMADGTETGDLVRAIERGLALRSRALDERARSLAVSYRWESVVERLASVYRRAVAEGVAR